MKQSQVEVTEAVKQCHILLHSSALRVIAALTTAVPCQVLQTDKLRAVTRCDVF